MNILGIETSCDETAICVVQADGGLTSPTFKILGNALFSQVKLHAEYGGVFPTIAKREHAKNAVPLLKKALEEADMLAHPLTPSHKREGEEILKTILAREEGLYDALVDFLHTYEKPNIDIIAVTTGPGLEPALWVGICFAKALGEAWNIPVVPTNHMEGHIISPLLITPSLTERESRPLGPEGVKPAIQFPALALLISGGHTELVLMHDWMKYELIGKTRDDAIGEAFDKVARLMMLPYPGGPEISKLAHDARIAHTTPRFTLPRPMIKSDNLDFSFSGIKTAVLYTLQKEPEISHDIKQEMSLEFENAVTEVLLSKTKQALENYEIKTLILGGGVVANTYIRAEFEKLIKDQYPYVHLLIPETSLSTDNAVMIAAAGYIRYLSGVPFEKDFKAQGNMQLS